MIYSSDYPLIYFPDEAGKTLNWYCGDDKSNYMDRNQLSWEYFNSKGKLQYKFNSLGYRTCELTELPEDYVLVFGCSYTEGVGLYEEDIWCNQLAQRLNFKVVNLAKAGTGPDIINLNNQLFVKNKFVKPKAVIIQWPQCTRKSFAYLKGRNLKLVDRNVNNWIPGTDHDSDWYFKRWILESGQLNYENSLHINSVTNLWNSLGIPVFNWTFSGDFQLNIDKDMFLTVKTEMTGRARDGAHDGSHIHWQVVEQIKDKVKCMI